MTEITKEDWQKTRTDLDRFYQERNAATCMRDGISFLIGWTKADNPEIAKRLEAILTQHTENREQDWI
tara:strand:- start:164 stop:367 length:204 start_codon:yes stop_codon:yes gene_type:complete